MGRDSAGGHLRRWRQTRSLSVRELAEQSGVSKATLDRIEAGSDLKLSTLRALIEALQIDEAGVLALLASEGLVAAPGSPPETV